MAAHTSPSSFLPNLPGLRPHVPSEAKGRKQLFVCVNGAKIMREPSGSGNDSVDSVDDMLSVTSIGVHSALRNDREEVVLAMGYHDENLQNGPRTRTHVGIYYFVADRSIKVVSYLDTHSGPKPMTTLPRQVLRKPEGDFYSPEDFVLGGTVAIAGTVYSITDGNQALRDHLTTVNEERSLDGTISTFGLSPRTKSLLPSSPSPTRATAVAAHGSGGRSTASSSLSPSWATYRSKKSEIKEYLEAKMGRANCNKTRDRFIAFGNRYLSFLCVTFDTRGHPREYAITYHLCDDTVDITTPTLNQNGGECQKILSRARIPRAAPNQQPGVDANDVDADSLEGADHDNDGFYYWSDFYIGAEIEIYTRKFTIIDASPVTRKFFEEHGLELGAPIVREDPAAASPERIREVPPHTGFGSEEDSLRSCVGSLHVEAPRQRHINLDAPVLAFRASIVSNNVDDVARKFVVTFYTDDNTIKILEPPVRNSGFVGGLFLSRQKCKRRNGEALSEADFVVGATVEAGPHLFLLVEADSGTAQYLATKRDISSTP